jgi:uncharacterized repeat protein (TIGR04052 family)
MSARTLSLLLGLTTGLGACNNGDTDHTHETDEHETDEHETDETDAMPMEEEVTLTFAATVGGQVAACGTDYTVGTGGATAQLADARLYVSGVQLRDAGGSWVDLTLDQDSVWQHEGVALLDFEDGTAGCADSGTSDLNGVVTGTLPAGTYTGLRFDVGVPFELNHLDSATAPSPLDSPGMFWAWQSGYKFVRVDWAVQGEGTSRWNVHVGATGCVSDASTQSPDEPCGRPNLGTIELADFDPAADEVAVDLGALISGVDVWADTAESPPGCMSSPAEPDDCGPTFGSLGMDFATGVCASDCEGQTVFEVEGS